MRPSSTALPGVAIAAAVLFSAAAAVADSPAEYAPSQLTPDEVIGTLIDMAAYIESTLQDQIATLVDSGNTTAYISITSDLVAVGSMIQQFVAATDDSGRLDQNQTVNDAVETLYESMAIAVTNLDATANLCQPNCTEGQRSIPEGCEGMAAAIADLESAVRQQLAPSLMDIVAGSGTVMMNDFYVEMMMNSTAANYQAWTSLPACD